jgi:predicted nucleic acid-binding protein
MGEHPPPSGPLLHLPDGSGVFIDANIFVLAGSTGPLGEQCREFLERVRQRVVQGFITAFVVGKVTHRVMVHEARQQLQRSARETVEYLQQNPPSFVVSRAISPSPATLARPALILSRSP